MVQTETWAMTCRSQEEGQALLGTLAALDYASPLD